MGRLLALVLVAGLAACGDSSSSYDGGSSYDSSNYESFSYGENGYLAFDEEREPFNEDAAREAAERELASEGYDHSYGCLLDCSGHEAGWQWRAENGYATEGNSLSFSEGGTAFDEAVEERVENMRTDYESGLTPDY